ncbi:MAG: hypothetical protein CMM37_12705 [Rhodospirillaceae bacterium]|nr:hypothetical protein [Rhodospirillaceae bacterium]
MSDNSQPKFTSSPLIKSVVARWMGISPNIRGAFCVIIGAFLLIVMAGLVKHLGKTLPAFEVLFIRFLAGLIVILPLVWRLGLKSIKTSKLHLHGARGFVGFMGNLCFFYALINISLADTVTIQFSRPLIMVVIAVLFLNEIIGFRRGIVTLLGFGGILLITKPFGEGFDPWFLVALSGTIFGTGVVLTIKILSRTEETVTIMFYFALFTTLLALIPAIFVWQTPSWTEFLLLIITGTLGIIGQGLFTHGIGLGDTTFVMPFDYMRIVYAFLIGILWFAETPGWWSYCGSAIIIVSSLYLLRAENEKINSK